MVEFNVAGMSCSHCVGAVTRAIKAIDSQARVQVDLEAHKVRIESTQDRAALAKSLSDAGYVAS
jgi:copper chaperone